MQTLSSRRASLGLSTAALLSLVVASGCGNGSAGRDTSGTPARDRAASRAARPEVAYELEKRWAVQPAGWNKAVAFHPEGVVVAVSAGRAHVLARDTGALLEQVAVGSVTDDGAFFLADGRLALICDTGVQLLRLPGGAVETVVSSSEEVAAGHAAAGALAIGSGIHVRVYDTSNWQEIETYDVAGEVNDVALSPDGKHVAVATETNLQLFERGGAGRRLHDERSTVVAFSADGARLFASARGFDAFTFDVASGAREVQMETGSWITAASFAGPDLVVATGSNGLEVYGPGGGEALEELDGNAAVGLAVEPGRLCWGDRSGTIHCFSAAPLEASSYVPAVASIETEPMEETSSGEGFNLSISNLSVSRGGDTPPGETSGADHVLVGTLSSASGEKLVMEGSGDPPPLGTTCTLSKKVDQELGGTSIQVWLAIAQVKVVDVKSSKLTLQVLEETSVVHVNGKKTNHFTEGAETKLVW